MVNPRVFFDVSVENMTLGRIIFELFIDTAPKTCENFRALCTGEKGLSPVSERPLYYKNSIIHRSIKDFMIQGGDFTKRNGMGGESIYGGPFSDEDLTRPLDASGLLCMANKGPDTNGSQFFITLRECSHLNGKHVVFGRIIRGYDEVVQKITQVPVDEKDRPTKPVVISNCGELVLRTKAQVPQPEVKTSESESEGSDRERRKKRRRSHRSKSPATEKNLERESRRKEKKSKRRKDPSRSPTLDDRRGREPGKHPEPEQETEEQYDARLEREEKERLEAARKKELEKIKKSYDNSSQASNGVRFKGRGRMKYIDPELHHKNYA